MNYFVTGANGFIGRRLVDALLFRGDAVVAFVRKQPTLPAAARVVYGDINDEAALRRAMEGCEVVLHLAGSVSFVPSERARLFRVNHTGTECVLRAARAAAVRRVVFVSSAATLGLSAGPEELRDENAPLDQRAADRNPYAASKWAAERACVAAAARGQDICIVNPSTVYGPGDYTLNSGTLIKTVATARVMPVPPGGANVVDVDDVVEGILAAAARGLSGERYILGGSNLSFAAIIAAIETAASRRPVLLPLPSLARLPMSAMIRALGILRPDRIVTPQIVEDTFAYKFYSERTRRRALALARQDRLRSNAATRLEVLHGARTHLMTTLRAGADQAHEVLSANQRFYEAIAGVYDTVDSRRNAGDEHRWVLDILARERDGLMQRQGRPAASLRLVDAGAGSGFLGLRARELFPQPILVDISPAMLRRIALPGALKITADCANLPLANASIDIIGAFATLHHLHSVEPFFEDAFRVLRTRRRLVL